MLRVSGIQRGIIPCPNILLMPENFSVCFSTRELGNHVDSITLSSTHE